MEMNHASFRQFYSEESSVELLFTSINLITEQLLEFYELSKKMMDRM